MSTQPPLVTVDLPDSKGKIEFSSIEDLEAWVTKERTFWRWLDNARSGECAPFCDIYKTRLQRMGTLVTEAKNNRANAGVLAQCIQNVTNIIRELYTNFRLPLDTSPEREFLASLNPEGNSIVALGALMSLTKARADQTTAIRNDTTRGAILATLFEKQISDSAVSEKAALDKLSAEYRGRFQDFVKGASGKLDELAKLSSSYTGQVAQQKTDFDAQAKVRDADMKSSLDGLRKEMKSITEAYNLELALHKPVQYWNKRAKVHLCWAIVFGVALVLLLAGAGIGLWEFFSTTMQASFEMKNWQLGVTAVGAFLGIWLIRIVVRLFLSNAHLQTDARQRQVMMQAYLALLRRPEAIDAKDRHLILEVLFRPASTGLVRDDAAPVTPANLAAKYLGQ